MLTKEEKQLMKESKQFAAFITEFAEAMKRHNVVDCLCVFGMNGDIRNTYIPLSEKGENDLYCGISDSLHSWLQASGFQKSGKPKHTTPIVGQSKK